MRSRAAPPHPRIYRVPPPGVRMKPSQLGSKEFKVYAHQRTSLQCLSRVALFIYHFNSFPFSAFNQFRPLSYVVRSCFYIRYT